MSDEVTITMPRESAERVLDFLYATPYDDKHAWAWVPIVRFADVLGRELPAWVREKATA